MLEAIPTNIFSSTFRVEQNNELVGEVAASIWRDKAQLELAEGTYELYREGQFSGDFVLEHNGKWSLAQRSDLGLNDPKVMRAAA